MKLSERAVELFESGYNCAQAVFGAFAEAQGMPVEAAMKLSSSFGGGVGRLREICGACSGMVMAAGMLYGYCDPEDTAAKKEHYALIRQLCGEFKEENGSLICREILGARAEVGGTPEARTPEYYKERPCVRCVRTAAKALEDYIEKQEKDGE